MKHTKHFLIFCLLMLGLMSCSPKLQLNNSLKQQYAISKDLPMDSAMLAFYKPYKQRHVQPSYLSLPAQLKTLVERCSTVAKKLLKTR